MVKILFIGPQGSGKSTQGKLLSKYLRIPYLSSGDIFREISKDERNLGEKVKKILNKGKLVDDVTTCEIFRKKLAENTYKAGFILDGYPRTVKQSQIFDPGFDLVFYLNISKKVSLERLLKRVREDDTPALIEARLVYYYKQTQPLLKYFKKRSIVREVDSEQEVMEIQSELRVIADNAKKDEAAK